MTGAETVQSFSVPNYSGLLYNKANTKTPFLNMISGRVKYTNSVEFVCGQYYTSEEGAIASTLSSLVVSVSSLNTFSISSFISIPFPLLRFYGCLVSSIECCRFVLSTISKFI